MNLKKSFYKALGVAWWFVVFGGVIFIDLGRAEPWLSISDIPGGMIGGFAIAMVIAIIGWAGISSRITRIERAEWREIGRQAGLEPTGDNGDTSAPELRGTIDGRTVSARYEKVDMGGDEG